MSTLPPITRKAFTEGIGYFITCSADGQIDPAFSILEASRANTFYKKVAGARSEFWGVASCVPWGWHDSYGKTEILGGWVTKICLKCTKKLG